VLGPLLLVDLLQGLGRAPLRWLEQVLFRGLARELERCLLRDEGRELLRAPGQGLERWSLRVEGRAPLRALVQRLLRVLELPQWSRGQHRESNEEREERGEGVSAQRTGGYGGMTKS